MNVNYYLKCDVCGEVTQVKIQVGWLEKHPVRVYCRKCGILMSGKFIMDQKEISYEYRVDNAKLLTACEPNYYIESSGELLTKKNEKYDSKDSMKYHIAPFMSQFYKMGDSYMKFKENIISFKYITKKTWPKYRRIFELWNLDNYDLTKQEILKCLPERLYPSDNKLEILRSMHALQMSSFSILYQQEFHEAVVEIHKEILEIDTIKVLQLIDYLNKDSFLDSCHEKVFNILNTYISVFEYLIPAYGACFYEEDIDFNTLGTTTCSFEDIKQFYLDIHETFGEMILLPIGLNNIKYRGEFQSVESKNSNISCFDDLKGTNKGKRAEYVTNRESFTKMMQINLNSQLRNSIGHNDYKYNGIDQVITYIPNPKTPSKSKNIYLLEFAIDCMKLVKGLIICDEILYQIRKIQYLHEGCIPKVTPKDFYQKVGRNEKCPCGSGEKYKKCHGRPASIFYDEKSIINF